MKRHESWRSQQYPDAAAAAYDEAVKHYDDMERGFDAHHDARAHVEIERLPIDRPAALAVVHRRVCMASRVHRGGDGGQRDVIARVDVHQLAALERRVAREHGHARGEDRGDVDDA
jgi:hypothetical protein